MQHSPRFLNYTTDPVRESIIPARSDQTNAVAVAATLLNIDSDLAARVPGGGRRGLQPFDGRKRGRHSGALKSHRREVVDLISAGMIAHRASCEALQDKSTRTPPTIPFAAALYDICYSRRSREPLRGERNTSGRHPVATPSVLAVVICPDGQINDLAVQPLREKYSASPPTQINSRTPAIPSHTEQLCGSRPAIGRPQGWRCAPPPPAA